MLGLGTLAKKVFGTPNDRKVKATRPLIEKINALEPEFEALSDEGLVAKTAELRDRATSGEDLNSLLPEAFANCREAAKRAGIEDDGQDDVRLGDDREALIEELRARGLDIRLLDVVFDILFTHCVRTLQKNPARATRMIAPSATRRHEPPGVMSHR